VKAGDVVKVRVLDIDMARKRISLSMRRDRNAGPAKPAAREDVRDGNAPRHDRRKPDQPAPQGALGAALSEALRKR